MLRIHDVRSTNFVEALLTPMIGYNDDISIIIISYHYYPFSIFSTLIELEALICNATPR